jgi:peptidyl-prolyl cis-trans isomerase B (cyclophilin B)
VVAGSAKRERQLARERYERQQQRRAAAAARRKRNQQITAVVAAVAIVIAGVVFLTNKLGGDDSTAAATKPTTAASVTPTPTASSSPSAAATGCTYTKTADKASKAVTVPTYDEAKAADYKKPFTATLKTNLGDIEIAMAAEAAPCTTNSFRHLATSKFYDSTSCHRLTTSGLFVLQCGDPTGTGGGGPATASASRTRPPTASTPQAPSRWPAPLTRTPTAASSSWSTRTPRCRKRWRRLHHLRDDHQGTRHSVEGGRRWDRQRLRGRRAEAEGHHRVRDHREELT